MSVLDDDPLILDPKTETPTSLQNKVFGPKPRLGDGVYEHRDDYRVDYPRIESPGVKTLGGGQSPQLVKPIPANQDECSLFPGVEASISINLPFGLPKIPAVDLTCQGLSVTMGSLNASLAAFLPIIRIAECVLKVIDAVMSVPDAISSLSPSPVLDALEALVGCVDYFLALTGLDPRPFIRMIRDICKLLLRLLACMRALLTVSLQQDEVIASLEATGDLDLALDLECLKAANRALKASIGGKLDGMKLIILLLNLIIGALPPVAAAMGENYPIDLGDSDFSPEGLADIESVLTIVYDLCVRFLPPGDEDA